MSDWRDRQVKDLGEIVTGRTPSTKRKDFYDGDYNLISPADLDNGKYIRTAHKRLTKLGFEQCRALPKDTVLVGCIGNVGKLGMVGNDQSATNQQINALICNVQSDPEFVYYCFHENRDKLEKRSVKTTVPILNKTNFGSFELSVPPLPEQKKIAHILSTIQRAIESQERIIQTTTELKKTLMHKLFTEGLRNEPQKQTEIGPVPESWEVVELEITGEVVYGIQAAVANNLEPVGTRILTNKNLTLGGGFELEKINYFELTTKRHRATILRKGDLLFNWRSGSKFHVGKTSFFDLDGEWVHSSFILRIRPNPEINGRYLFYYLNHLREAEYFVKLQTYAINAKFNKSAVNALTTVVPSREEQDQIADTLNASQLKIDSAENKRKVLQDLFRTLLHELMTAKTRVHELEISA